MLRSMELAEGGVRTDQGRALVSSAAVWKTWRPQGRWVGLRPRELGFWTPRARGAQNGRWGE